MPAVVNCYKELSDNIRSAFAVLLTRSTVFSVESHILVGFIKIIPLPYYCSL